MLGVSEGPNTPLSKIQKNAHSSADSEQHVFTVKSMRSAITLPCN
jgi:hypothetical protein